MQDHGLVSIIMPSHNSAKFIAESIESSLKQTYQNWELLIQEDGSIDNTLEIIKRYALIDKRIKCIARPSAMGAAISRNEALQRAKGRWVAFLDSDDLWLPNKLERQLKFMVENGYDFCYHEYSEIDEAGKELGITVSGINKVGKFDMYSCCWPGCLSVMYNREAVGLIQINDIRKNNDTAMWLKVVEKTPCYLLKENLARYRRRQNSITPPSLWGRIWAHYPLFRKGCEMNPVLATFWTLMNVIGNGYKKLRYVKKSE